MVVVLGSKMQVESKEVPALSQNTWKLLEEMKTPGFFAATGARLGGYRMLECYNHEFYQTDSIIWFFALLSSFPNLLENDVVKEIFEQIGLRIDYEINISTDNSGQKLSGIELSYVKEVCSFNFAQQMFRQIILCTNESELEAHLETFFRISEIFHNLSPFICRLAYYYISNTSNIRKMLQSGFYLNDEQCIKPNSGNGNGVRNIAWILEQNKAHEILLSTP